MRISVTLEDDVYRQAILYASARGITLGKAIGELIRKAQAAPSAPPDIRRSQSGLAMFPPTGRIVTEKMVKEIYALQGSLREFPLEADLAEERRAARERENRK